MDNMFTIDNQWDKSIFNMSYGDGYDIRLHAIQVGLNLIHRRSNKLGPAMFSVDLSTIVFGYFDVQTEDALRKFQGSIGLVETGKIDETTYQMLFDALRREFGVIILHNGIETLKIYEITKDLLEQFPWLKVSIDSDGETLSPMQNTLEEGGQEEGSYPDVYNSDNSREMDNSFNNIINGVPGSSSYAQVNIPNNSETLDPFWDSLVNGYGKEQFAASMVYTAPNGGKEYTDLSGNVYGDGDEDFVGHLLANSIYKGNFDYDKPMAWKSTSKMDINVAGFKYEKSEKHKTFFAKENSADNRKSKFNITIVYGTNGQFAKQIVDVRPRSTTQEVDASGNPIYDIIEFVAKDVIESNNTRG
jgi:hypothetical protein